MILSIENLEKWKEKKSTHVYTAERGLLEPALGLYGLGSPAMLISKEKEMLQHDYTLHPSQNQSTAKHSLQLPALLQ